MRVRNKNDGAVRSALLRLNGERSGNRRFVLQLTSGHHRLVELGPLAATIGYELVEFTPTELMSLKLAGFRLRRAERVEPQLQRLIPLLSGGEKRVRRKSKSKAVLC